MKKTTRTTSNGPVTLEYTVGASETIISKNYELLVIGCDPRNLYNICDYTEDELAIFEQMTNFKFHTSLLRVHTHQKQQDHAVIFSPTPLEEMAGKVYGYRNETAKQFSLQQAIEMEENLITVYQLVGAEGADWPAEEFEHLLQTELEHLPWWPFGTDYTVLKTVTTPYFDHFSAEGLANGLPWKWLNMQGARNTIYVHASTCFESVYDCWAYANLMMNNIQQAQDALPSDLNAPIAILGAGPSGLLFALRLKRLGYTNIQILESTDRYGGKTHTIIEDGPYPPGHEGTATVCELGTCYLSPSYDPMVADLKEFLVGNERFNFSGNEKNFRGIVTEGQFPPHKEVPPVMNYADYVLLKAETLTGTNEIEAKLILAYDLVKYALIHDFVMGFEKPMPTEEPTDFLESAHNKTFFDFLKEHDLEAMVGMLQYGYEVQGYGPLSSIPAFYGLVWMTPKITNTILFDSLGHDTPIVTAWRKGWGDLWKQIVQKEQLHIIFEAHTRSIRRG